MASAPVSPIPPTLPSFAFLPTPSPHLFPPPPRSNAGIWVPPGRSAFVFAIGSRKSNYNAATSDLYSNITIKAVSGGPVTSPECYFQLGSGVAQGTQVFQAQTWPGHGGRCPSGVGGTSIILSRPE